MTLDPRRGASKTTIRPAEANDADRIADVFVASRCTALPFIEEPHSAREMRAWISKTVVPRGSTWVICKGERVAGFMTFNQSEIQHLYLDPAETRQGLGSQLLEFAKSGHHHLSLSCFAENHAACRFYEHHGFKAVAHGDGSNNEEGAPDILYEWHGP